MKYSKITSQIWVGPAINNPADAGDLTVVRTMMAAVKPTRVIDCREEFDDKQLLTAAGVLEDPDVAGFYLFDGIPDWTPGAGFGLHPIPDSFFQKAHDFWMPRSSNPEKIVYVHCTQGINRSVTLTYAILVAQGMSRVQAIVTLNEHRPVTGLSDFIDHPWRENAEHALFRLGYAVR
jgi:hypothetical protein